MEYLLDQVSHNTDSRFTVYSTDDAHMLHKVAVVFGWFVDNWCTGAFGGSRIIHYFAIRPMDLKIHWPHLINYNFVII